MPVEIILVSNPNKAGHSLGAELNLGKLTFL
jgi:hypothetical protein